MRIEIKKLHIDNDLSHGYQLNFVASTPRFEAFGTSEEDARENLLRLIERRLREEQEVGDDDWKNPVPQSKMAEKLVKLTKEKSDQLFTGQIVNNEPKTHKTLNGVFEPPQGIQ